MIAKGKEKDVEAKQLRDQIDRLKQEFEAQVAEKMGVQDQQDNSEKEQLLKKMDHLEDDQKTKSQAIEDQKAEIQELKDNLQHYQK